MAETETEKVHKIIFFLLPGLAERQLQNRHTHMTVSNFQMVPFLFCYVILIDE
jgi:hypothetical protein